MTTTIERSVPPAAAMLLRSTVDLDQMSSWSTYKKDFQDKLWKYAEGIRTAQYHQGLDQLSEAQILFKAKQELTKEGEFREFLDKVYHQSWRTGYARLELYEKALEKLTEAQVNYLITYGPSLMPYRTMSPKEFLNATEGLPKPKSDKPEEMKIFIERVGEKYKEIKSERRLGTRKISFNDALKDEFNHILNMFSNAKIKSTEKQNEFLEKLVGLIRTQCEIPGRGKVEVPEGFRVRRGRPPKDSKSSKDSKGSMNSKNSKSSKNSHSQAA